MCYYCRYYCTALHCAALHCTALHCTALHCTALHRTALHCTVQCTAVSSQYLLSIYSVFTRTRPESRHLWPDRPGGRDSLARALVRGGLGKLGFPREVLGTPPGNEPPPAGSQRFTCRWPAGPSGGERVGVARPCVRRRSERDLPHNGCP